jgi:hypothetical protein
MPRSVLTCNDLKNSTHGWPAYCGAMNRRSVRCRVALSAEKGLEPTGLASIICFLHSGLCVW